MIKEVSLYIPCFNSVETIGFCLEAVYKQTYPIKEVVVVDDGSTDGSIEVICQYPVRVIRHGCNRGLATTRNTAIKNINTDFIASLDADCVSKPDWLKQLMKNFSSTKVAGVGGKLLETHSSSVFDFWRSVHMKQYWQDKETMPPFLFGSNAVFRRKEIINIGLYNEDYKSNYEDVDISSRFKKAGYTLIYEPKAMAQHLRKDNICSILNSYWNWNLAYYQKKEYYSNSKSFIFKITDNFGLANRYIEEDICSKRYQLIYLDFLLSLHHSLRDFEYFISQNKQEHRDYPPVSFWLSLVDLTFFYHLESTKGKLSTLMPKKVTFLQNYFALNLILGNVIQEKFKCNKFKKILYKHMLLSVYRINDSYLLDKLLSLVELHRDWNGLIKKRHPNLNTTFLENLSLAFKKWIEGLINHFPNIIQLIEISGEKTDAFSFLKRRL